MIDTPFDTGRQINIWLLSGHRHVLIDTGVCGSPSETIFPYLESIGLAANDLDLVINLHAHADHVGGNGELFAASGHTLAFGAHECDASAIEDHRILAKQVYQLRDTSQVETLLTRCGAHVPIRHRYHGGEIIPLDGFSLEIIHAPGHTEGNLAVYDRTHRALIHGESVMGPSQQTQDGLWTTPFGADPNAYRRTLDALMALDIDLFLSSHAPPVDGAEGRSRILASLESLDRFEQTCLSALSREPHDLAQLVDVVARDGRYARTPRLERQVLSIMDALARSGRAASGPDGWLSVST